MNDTEKDELLKALHAGQKAMHDSITTLNNKFDNLVIGKHGGGVLSRMSVQEERLGGLRWAIGCVIVWVTGLTLFNIFPRQN